MLIPHTRYPRFMLTIKHPILGVMDVTSYVDSWEYELGDVSGIGTGGSGADSVISILTFTLRNSGQNLYYWDEDAIIDESIPLDDLKEFPDDSKAVDLFTYLFQIEPNLARKSFSPRDQLTPWNKDAPLLYQNREVELYFADDPAKDLELLCRMYVSDIEPGRSTVRVKALDPAKMLQRAYILEKREYGSQGGVPAETVIEQIINNNVPDYANYAVTDPTTYYDTESFPVPEQPNVETFILKREPITITGEAVDIYFDQTPIDPSLITTDGRQVTIDLSGYSELVGVELTYTYQVESFLYCPVPSQFMLTPYVPEYQSVWDAIQDIATQRGWYLGYRMVDGAWRLAFIEPPRDKTIPDWTLTADHDFYTQDLATSDKDIRNLVKITYRNKATGKREAITVKDQDSIDLHGLSAMEIGEADTSNIDTTEEAFRMANSALHDLSSLTATTNIVMPLFPDIKLFDLIAVENKFISSTVDLFAVDSIRHSWSSGRLRTELVGSGKVIGGVKRWLKKETRPGRDGDPAKHGKTFYTWIKYADSPTSGMSDSPDGKTYIGIAYNKEVPDESDNYADYSWSLIKGADGIPGPPGDDGESLYTWIRYADTPSSGMDSDPTGKKYMGIAYNKESSTPSSNYSDYSWSLVEGPQGPPGQDGVQGPKGDPGPGTPYLGEHDPTQIYYNRSNRRDVVHIVDGGQKKYYIYKGPDGVSGAWDPDNWEYYGDTLDFVATKLLLAEDASITKTLRVGQGGTSTAGISGEGDYRYWAGGDDPSTAPFSVNEEGEFTSRKAKIVSEDGANEVQIADGKITIIKNSVQSNPIQNFQIGSIGNNQTVYFNPNNPEDSPFTTTPDIYLFPESILTYKASESSRDQRFVCMVLEKSRTHLKAQTALVVDNGEYSEYSKPTHLTGLFTTPNYDWYLDPNNYRNTLVSPIPFYDQEIQVVNAKNVTIKLPRCLVAVYYNTRRVLDGSIVSSSESNITTNYNCSVTVQIQRRLEGSQTWITIGTQKIRTLSGNQYESFVFNDSVPSPNSTYYYRLVVSAIEFPFGQFGPTDHLDNGWEESYEWGGAGGDYYHGSSVYYTVDSIEITNVSDETLESGSAHYFAIERY